MINISLLSGLSVAGWIGIIIGSVVLSLVGGVAVGYFVNSTIMKK
jgi:uncharacterized protein YneF (UPF0154 family)